MGRAATGTIRKLPSGRYQARITTPDGERRTAPRTFVAKRDAQVWLAQMQADISRGEWTAIGHSASMHLSFGDYAAQWLEKRKVGGRALGDRTRANYEGLLERHILPTFEQRALRSITRDDVEHWHARCAQGAPTTRAHAYSLLRTVLASAVLDGHLSDNPARIRGAGSTERRHEVRPATLDELAALTDAMPERYRLLVQLAAWCALRYGELCELRRGDVDAAEGVLRIRRAVVTVPGEGFTVKSPKSRAGIRDVAIPPHLLPLVREHLLRWTAPGSDGLLFPSAGDPTRHLRQSSLARVYYPARAAAGRDDLRFHDLRHTGAVYAAQSGATLAELMLRLGHSTVTAALTYQHAASGRDKAIAQRLSEMAQRQR